ncbi:hypothetical protein QE422_001785 [Chryseobacterium sp. SORGH_AS 447]|uniref:DUF4255 domain-containing protein n=1 Tax=Chryseobacterium sp. SORGH_AS_0447 TaxID=3041769 RepID=UPI002782EB2E|nr:DUF4255 domain-containing protein [Chryseobacterium sp. SORGH_AS_0447]MDQ1161417.1 hypothetical protein [Chryseobacterium sp. SORGH_AS_0447]
MINKVLNVLKDKLNSAAVIADTVVVADVAKHDDGTSGLSDKVIITLLNVQEESTLKNAPRYNKTRTGTTPPVYQMKMESDPAYVNLYVMISANRTSYEGALVSISKVIEVIQASNVSQYVDPGNDRSKDFSFRAEMHSVPFEQLSYVWGLLGGKVMPSVLYKISVIKIAAVDSVDVALIDEVDVKSIAVDQQ